MNKWAERERERRERREEREPIRDGGAAN